MAPPGESSGKNIDQNKEKTVQAKADEKFKRSIMKRRKFLKDLRRRSTIKRKLVVKEWGIVNYSRVKQKLFCRRELEEIERFRYRLNPSKHRISKPRADKFSTNKPEEKLQPKIANKEDTYKTSGVFLKGTQSANPHNDYSQHFVDTGQRPQNFIRDTAMNERFEEYPKLKELIRLKDEQIRNGATLPMYQKCDLSAFDLSSLGIKFDVILIEPPLEEYQRRTSGITYSWEPWDFEEIMNLKIEDVSAPRSFVFLWCGSYEGLDHGRECLKKWGYRRCEDICWIKTNASNPGNNTHLEPKAIFQTTKEHCLMGIKGTVRRNQDGHFIHANVDLDIISTEEPEIGSSEKPEEIFHMIEHFCLGRRRLHLFGSDSTIRPGWLTLGPSLSSSNFHKETYHSFFDGGENSFLLSQVDEIENLRPKTPPPKGRGASRGGGVSAGLGRGTMIGRGYPV